MSDHTTPVSVDEITALDEQLALKKLAFIVQKVTEVFPSADYLILYCEDERESYDAIEAVYGYFGNRLDGLKRVEDIPHYTQVSQYICELTNFIEDNHDYDYTQSKFSIVDAIDHINFKNRNH